MGKLASWGDLGRSEKANWIDSWKESGMLKGWLHREPPSTRIRHSFREIVREEGKNGVTVKVKWLPWNCWEPESYYKQLRIAEKSAKGKHRLPAPHAQLCGACRFIEHLKARTDIPNDATIFSFRAGRETRDIPKLYLIGKAEGRDAYQDNLTGKSEFILSIIPADEPEKGVCLTNEPWSIGQALAKRISNDLKEDGEDHHPERRPVCYLFECDRSRTPVSYNVSRYEKAKLTPAIEKLWAGPPPDVEQFTKRGDPKQLRDAMEAAYVYEDSIPWDEIFGPSIAIWEAEEEGDTSFDPSEYDAPEVALEEAIAEVVEELAGEAAAEEPVEEAAEDEVAAEGEELVETDEGDPDLSEPAEAEPGEFEEEPAPPPPRPVRRAAGPASSSATAGRPVTGAAAAQAARAATPAARQVARSAAAPATRPVAAQARPAATPAARQVARPAAAATPAPAATARPVARPAATAQVARPATAGARPGAPPNVKPVAATATTTAKPAAAAKPAATTAKPAAAAAPKPAAPKATAATTARAGTTVVQPVAVDVMIYRCEACEAEWPENLPTCPGCGMEPEPEPGPEPEPAPATGKVRKF